MNGIDKAASAKLVLISGDEPALRRRAWENLQRAAGVGEEDFDFQSFSGESDPSEWLAAAGTSPFLGERRTVLVRHVLRCDPERAKAQAWGGLPDSALLVLVADDEAGDEDRQRRMKAHRAQLERLVTGAGGQVVKCDAKTGELKGLVRQALEAEGKRISERAMDTLSEMTAGSVSRALEELPKLLSYVGPEAAVQEEDVRAVVMPSREWSVFRLVDAAVDGDSAEALRQLRILVGSASKAEDAAFRNILPQLSRALRLAWQARAALEFGSRPDQPSEALAGALLQRPNLAAEKEFVQSRATRVARKLGYAELAAMLQEVSDADARLKGMLPSFSAMETLEQTVLRLAQIGKPAVAGRR